MIKFPRLPSNGQPSPVQRILAASISVAIIFRPISFPFVLSLTTINFSVDWLHCVSVAIIFQSDYFWLRLSSLRICFNGDWRRCNQFQPQLAVERSHLWFSNESSFFEQMVMPSFRNAFLSSPDFVETSFTESLPSNQSSDWSLLDASSESTAFQHYHWY
jgi:hypothetical protein